MTRIEFRFNVQNKLQQVAHLCQQAMLRRLTVTVITPDTQTSEQLSRHLWTGAQLSFLPHCNFADALAAQTPIHIDHQREGVLHDDVLINLSGETLPFFARFTHLIELVGDDETDRTQARLRYREYRDKGYEINSRDMQHDA